jgi:hypothetical protein
MKTKFTTITMLVLIILGIAANAEQKKSEIGKQYFLDAKKVLLANSKNQDEFKHLFNSGNQLSVPGYSEDYSWNEELNDWQHISNTTYSYSNTGKLTEEIAQDAETNYYLSRNTYSYDLGYNLEEVSYTWIIDEWIPVAGERSSNTISAESQINGVIEQTIENGIWVNKTWIKYILDQYNIPTQLHEYHWDGHDWILHSRTGLLTWADWPKRELAAYTKQYMQENNWVNAERFSKQYDGDNYTATTEIWENEQWVNSKRESYSRNDTQEELVMEKWTAQGWGKTEKYQGTFDNYRNPTGMKYSSWFDTKWELELELFMDLSYNESNDVTEMVIRSWNPSLTAPENLSKYIFSNFLHFTTDVPEIISLNNVNVFPNPVRSTFNIQIDENKISYYQVNIVNLSGQTIFSNTYSNPSISINADGFKSGMYLLNIKTDDGNFYSQKLLKQ